MPRELSAGGVAGRRMRGRWWFAVIDPTRQPPNVKVLSVSGILAETIHNVFSDESVSGIFPGGNQLF